MTHTTQTCTYIGSYGLKPTCCAPTVLGSYCAEHYSVVYAKGTRLGRRVKDMRKAEAIRQLMSDFNAAVEQLEAEGFDVYGETEAELDLDEDPS